MRDCHHGSLARSCEECALMRDLVDACHGWALADAALSAKSSECEALRAALMSAEAALADIGDSDREPGDDLAWCEARAAKALPTARAALAGDGAKGRHDGNCGGPANCTVCAQGDEGPPTPAPEPFEVPDGWTRGWDLGDGTPTFYHCPTFEHRCAPAEGGRMVTCACGARWTIPAQERGGEA